MRLPALSVFSPFLLAISVTNAAPSAQPQPPSHNLSRPNPLPPDPSSFPYRTLAGGISVINTAIVRDAEAFAKKYSPGSYNHIMRSWLWGVLHLRHNSTLATQIDLEVHAVGLMLHDIASDHNLSHPFVSPDRRFEIDSAIAATDFIRAHPDGSKWPDWRVQRVFDGIALHAEPKFALHKEADVFAIYWGNELEWSYGRPGGEKMGITEAEHEMVMKSFPPDDGGGPGGEGSSTGLLWFIGWYCKYKPESTYDTWMQPYGDMVPGYSPVGHRLFDGALAAAGVNVSGLVQ
ncbi:hypothetical protein B0H66DRAFT_555693 [Apodospora peruviana]|uniref:HD domain-containing protein n=1 Tax=Apodospora peruviana TaxID=516989 RepID=A0AAE0IDL4_9PEZI|nr:hypothetical protein B0H66DRAFT_555693 [Apodospora peruviana]